MSNESIFDKARELGEMISHCETRKRAEEASNALMTDPIASKLITEYNEKREAKIDAYKDKEPTPEEIQKINEYLQGEFNKIAANPIVQEYIEASSDLEAMLSQMDSIIQQSISGHHGCGGSCSSCSGCH